MVHVLLNVRHATRSLLCQRQYRDSSEWGHWTAINFTDIIFFCSQRSIHFINFHQPPIWLPYGQIWIEANNDDRCFCHMHQLDNNDLECGFRIVLAFDPCQACIWTWFPRDIVLTKHHHVMLVHSPWNEFRKQHLWCYQSMRDWSEWLNFTETDPSLWNKWHSSSFVQLGSDFCILYFKVFDFLRTILFINASNMFLLPLIVTKFWE